MRAFVKASEGFTATLWGDEFNGIPIEVVVNGKNAQDASAIQDENNAFRVRIRQIEQENDGLRFAARAVLDDQMSDCRKSLAEQLEAALGTLPPSTPYVCAHGYAYGGSIMCVQCAADAMAELEQQLREQSEARLVLADGLREAVLRYLPNHATENAAIRKALELLSLELPKTEIV